MSIQAEIRKTYGDFKLDIKLDSSSKRIGILGASGCGKSMTLKSIAGIEQPDSGRICIEGKTVYDSAQKINWKPQKRKIGYLFQNYALFPTMTVEANIGAGVRGTKAEKKERTSEMIRKFRWKAWSQDFGAAFRRAAAKSGACKDHGLPAGDDSPG